LKTRFLLLPFALLLVLGLAACGGGGGSSDSSSSGSAEDGEIEVAIEKSVTEKDPSKCTELLTQSFLDQVEEGEGKAALEECEASAESGENDPESVTVTNVQIDGSKATADAKFVGSSLGGQTTTIALVKEGGQWKLNRLLGFVNLDTDALAKVFEEQLEGSNELTPDQISCIADGLRESSDEEIEALLLEKDTGPLSEIAEGCK
jgi:hypothetical protein